MSEPIGLIAGGGRLPILVAQGIRDAGHPVACVGLRDQFDPDLPALCDRFRVVPIARLGTWCRSLRRWDVRQAVLVGKVQKTKLHEPLRFFRYLPDLRTIRLVWHLLRHDSRPATVLTGIADLLGRDGVELVDSTRYIQSQMAEEGVLTRRQPSPSELADIDFGWPLVLRLNELEIGQAMAVKEREVFAVEAIEGTDAMIERAGKLCRRGGWTLLKTARAGHDMRFDVPTIGPQTIEQMHKYGATCLAVGVGRVILVDKPQLIEIADRYRIAVVGRQE